ncbi:MAG: hypothetical protein JWR42_1360 [Marmoricola sp.]|nr:hypothetical protein [Marmoricola sp.]
MHDAPFDDTRPAERTDEHPGTPPPDTSVKVAHLVVALVLLGTAATWVLVATHVITPERLTVLAPALLIAAGVIGLVASLASSRNRRHHPGPAPTGPGQDGTDRSDLR